jgi:hypothetical protein
MTREDPITYEELPAEHKQKYDVVYLLVSKVLHAVSYRASLWMVHIIRP